MVSPLTLQSRSPAPHAPLLSIRLAVAGGMWGFTPCCAYCGGVNNEATRQRVAARLVRQPEPLGGAAAPELDVPLVADRNLAERAHEELLVLDGDWARAAPARASGVRDRDGTSHSEEGAPRTATQRRELRFQRCLALVFSNVDVHERTGGPACRRVYHLDLRAKRHCVCVCEGKKRGESRCLFPRKQ